MLHTKPITITSKSLLRSYLMCNVTLKFFCFGFLTLFVTNICAEQEINQQEAQIFSYEDYLSVHDKKLLLDVSEKKEKENNYSSGLPKEWFKELYLARYYPKAHVICHNFCKHLTVDELIACIADVVELLTKDPLFYFVNYDEQHAPETHYWEYVIDQIALIYRFLRNCSVTHEGLLECKEEFFEQDFSDKELLDDDLLRYYNISRPLLSVLSSKQMQVIHDLLALSYDYNNKMFNEGILFFDAQQAQRYQQELIFLTGKLQNSVYGVDYQEALTTSKELLALLRQQNNVDFSLELGLGA